MIIYCNYLTYDADDFHQNKIAYNDDIRNAPSLLTPGAIDLSEVCSVCADEDASVGKKLGELSIVGMKSGASHTIDIPTDQVIQAMAQIKAETIKKIKFN